MALKRKGSWLVVSAVLAVTALMMLGLAAAAPQEVRSRIAAAFQVRTRAGNVDKKPSRFIKDPNPAFSSIAVNAENNMVVMTDENLFRIVEYSRLDNTPPTARFTEPKRFIGGDQTRTEMVCGAYIDTKNDLIIVANHGHRRFYGGEAVSTLTETWEEWIGKSSEAGELNGLPRRYLPGLGKFEMPSINIYARSASGNTPPLRVIKGPRTQLNWPSHVAVHEERGEIFVANDADDSVLVFRTSDSGDIAPTRVIQGPKPPLKNPTALMRASKKGDSG